MQAYIRLTGETARPELTALADWLSREDELRGRSAIERPEAHPGHMGGMSEVVIVALGAQGRRHRTGGLAVRVDQASPSVGGHRGDRP